VHRIDKDTSGLICIAKNDNAHNFLAEQLKDHSMHREYYALVKNVIKENNRGKLSKNSFYLQREAKSLNNKDDKEKQGRSSGAENEAICDSVIETGSAVAENSREAFYCLSIIGQIEGHYTLEGNQKATKYDHLLPLLVSLEEDERIDGILILLNTMGGDVEAGLAISEVIASLDKPTVSVVLGGGHSIGVPLAVSASRSFIVPSATMTIHPVRINGLVIGAPQTYNYFRDMQNRITDFITAHSRAEKRELDCLMMKPDEMANDIGSVLDGRQAVECGLIDSIGGLADALAALHGMIEV
jgi:ATP-dependent protease ClpP protease subunit